MEECRDKFLVDKLVNAARTSRILILYLRKIQLELRLLKVDVDAHYLIGITQQKELMVLSIDKILGFSVLNSFSKDFKTTRNQQKQTKKLSPKKVFTPTLTKDNKSNIKFLTKLPKLCTDNKSIKSNDPNQKQITKPSPTAEKTQPLIPTKYVSERIKEEIKPSPTAEKTQPLIPAKYVSERIKEEIKPSLTADKTEPPIPAKYVSERTKEEINPSLIADKTEPPIPTKYVSEPTKRKTNPTLATDKTEPPILTNNISQPTLKGTAQKTNLTQTAKKYKNQETKNDATISIRNQNGNSIIS